jgi:pimeloyl-ACP methyl ester carboxylesterase
MAKELNNVRYWTYHPENLPTCIFIHGFTGSHEGFQYIISDLPDFHIIVPDLPGFGESKLTLQQYTIDELAKKTNEFVKALNLTEPPYLVSHSMGGLVAASMLSQNPELFAKKTVFISPVATTVSRLDSRSLGAFLGRMQYFLGKTVPAVGSKLVTSRLISRLATSLILTTNEPEMKKKINAHHFKNLDYISSIDYYHQLHIDINKRGAVDYAEQLRRFSILVITGDKDNVTPLATERKFVEAVQAKLEIIPGVGHLLHYEKPTAVAAAIGAFLRS